MNSAELAEKVKRFKRIGEEIAALSAESRRLRKEIAVGVDELGLGRVKVNSEEPVEFLIGDIHVSVLRAKMEDDFTIIPRQLKQIGALV